jgi:hypothetical protein
MYLIVLAMGVVTAIAGAIMIGFGIPINEFGIGNTLISAGTTAIVGGVVLIGLAATLRQLRAIADTVENRSWPVATNEARAFGANLYPSGSKPALRPGEGPGDVAGTAIGIEGLRQAARDEYVLQPRFAARPPPKEPQDRKPLNQEDEPYGTPEGHDREAEEPSPFAPALGTNARGERSRGFDAIWPAATSQPSPGLGASHLGASHDETEAAVSDDDHEEAVETASSSILKSGVIDGMVYTLYTDGSIEAELPQGTLKFVSIDELRDYLLNKE